jgi:2'-5' RNA ligase
MSAVHDPFAGAGLPPGREARPPGVVFFALKPDAEAIVGAGRIVSGLRGMHGFTGKALMPERLHVTLLPIGGFPELRDEDIEAVKTAAAAVKVEPFEIVFDRVASFNGGSVRPVVLIGTTGAAEAKILQRFLVEEMRKVGLYFRRMPHLTPHMTLLYDRRIIAEQPVAAVRWTVREFVLVHSHHGRSRHVSLARWPLRGWSSSMH